ncbi:MAG: hypothetical protein SFZ23_02735 [Planctomycetota bacterium]|nr:hypothetical protein [Planctomycetota bacterium]
MGRAALAQARRRRKTLSVLGFTLGVLALAAAIWSVAGAGGAWQAAQRHVLDSSRVELLLLAIALPPLHIILSALALWALTRQYGRVGFLEMCWLVSGAWLLNFLPLRPGLLGRVAYHKAINGIAIRDSARALVLSIATGAAAILLAFLIAIFVANAPWGPWVLALPVSICGLIAWSTWRGQSLDADRLRPFPMLAIAVGARYADVLVWSLRYLLVFEAIGMPVRLVQSVAIASVGQLASLVPFVGNGLGLREWAVGLASEVLPNWTARNADSSLLVSGQFTTAQVGVLADLMNRLVEVVVCMPLALIGLALVARRMRPSSSGPPPSRDAGV